MANVIVRCPKCGYQFVEKSPNNGIFGGIVGAIITSVLGISVTIASVGFAAPFVGGFLGFS